MKEVNKRQWSRLCRDLTQANRFARTEIVRVDPDGRQTVETDGAPLIDLSLSRRRGKIAALDASVAQIRNGSPVAIVIALGAPSMILRESVDDGHVKVLDAYNDDGHRLKIRIRTTTRTAGFDDLVREMAYFLAEARGFTPGYDKNDWFMAEKVIRELARDVERQVETATA